MENENKEAAFLESIVKNIVDKPESVKVDQDVDQQGIKLTLKVDQDDMRRIIGKQGKTANAIRTVMHSYGGRNNSRISVLIEEPAS